MSEQFTVVTTDPGSTYVFKPGALYFADFRLETPFQYYNDFSVVRQFETNLKDQIVLAGNKVNEHIEVATVIAYTSQPATGDPQMHVTGALDPSSWSTTFDEPAITGFRVYFRSHTPAVVIFVGIVAVALAIAFLAGEVAPILERICLASENIAATVGDVATEIIHAPGNAVQMIGKYALPLAAAFAAFGYFILGYWRKK